MDKFDRKEIQKVNLNIDNPPLTYTSKIKYQTKTTGEILYHRGPFIHKQEVYENQRIIDNVLRSAKKTKITILFEKKN